jgi:hypothetical protein
MCTLCAESKPHHQGIGGRAALTLIVAGAATDLLETRLSIERERRRIILTDFKE